MPRLPAYLFYVADYRADTRHLSPMQHFAYREILDEIFLSGQHQFPPSVLDEDIFLRSLCKPDSEEQWRETRHVLLDGPRALLQLEDGKITQKRMAIEVEKAIKRYERSSKANRARWGIAEQGEDEENAATVKPGPISSNGNGSGYLKRGQYQFLAADYGKWREENSSLFVGMTQEAWERAFELRFGLTWKQFERERDHHTGKDP